MKLSTFKKHLTELKEFDFKLPNGRLVPSYFHVTEVGIIHKHFIDCGGTVREEKAINFQLWKDDRDNQHRLKASKLLSIIELSEKKLGVGDHPIEVEYQSDTIGKYGLDFDGKHFLLTTKETDCLAKSLCGISSPKQLVLEIVDNNSCCTPGGGCC